MRQCRRNMSDNKLQLAQQSHEAFAAGDRKFFEQHLAENFTFSSPLDVGLDRDGYFKRCWPGAGNGQKFNFLRLIQHDEEVVVTYEITKPNGDKGRNTEIVRIKDDKNRQCRSLFWLGHTARSLNH
ncbi:MAG: ketosteroid isomerase [Verrucomicrobia bacterium]|nr:MAG: ketosteroid isomerase [Verrucomicrobiota bacterium]PYK68149.1 MAG: ketosteroid isomerase [Verrucomicrobiota bacterium]